jgi:hypothetical protein
LHNISCGRVYITLRLIQNCSEVGQRIQSRIARLSSTKFAHLVFLSDGTAPFLKSSLLGTYQSSATMASSKIAEKIHLVL